MLEVYSGGVGKIHIPSKTASDVVVVGVGCVSVGSVVGQEEGSGLE